jgi:hypothetical protein
VRAAIKAAVLGLLLQTVVTSASAQQPAPEVTAEEEAACRPDAIRLCFFSIPNAESLRACLRENKADLSKPCRALITSRGG